MRRRMGVSKIWSKVPADWDWRESAKRMEKTQSRCNRNQSRTRATVHCDHKSKSCNGYFSWVSFSAYSCGLQVPGVMFLEVCQTSNLTFILTSVLSACPHAGKLGLGPVSAHTLPVGLPPPIGRSRQNRVRGAEAPGTSMKPLEGLKIDVT